ANPIRLQARLMAAALARQRAALMRRLSLMPAGAAAAALPSIFDPIYVGINEFGLIVLLTLMYRNILIGGEPGSGKSALLNNIVAHAALSLDCRLCLLDGKLVELGLWRRVADVFVGPDLDAAIATLRKLQQVINNRYAYLTYCERRKITPADVFAAILCA